MRKALIIGLENYPGNFLKGCHYDAKEIDRVLKQNEDEDNFGCRLLIDDAGKTIGRVQLRQNITELFEAPGYETVLLYFSGHGTLNARGGYIVTPDARLYDEGISMDEILALANQSEAINKIIILDCCNSGAFGNPQINNGNITQISQGVTILTACTRNQNAIQNIFTGLLIEALEGGAADLTGNITAGSIYWFIDKALGAWGPRPVFKTVVNSYVPVRKVKPPIPLEVLRKLTGFFETPEYEFLLDPSYEFTAPEANPDHIIILKNLQKMVSGGLVKPVGEEHMYFAAMNSKSCKLTVLGQCYWRFVKEGRI